MNNLMQDIIGSWELIKMESFNEKGESSFPWGQQICGLLIYEATGYMSLQIFRTDNSDASVETHHSYFGEYKIDLNRNICFHKIRYANRPEWIDSIQERFFTITGNELVLKSPYILIPEFNEPLSFITTWQKLKPLKQFS